MFSSIIGFIQKVLKAKKGKQKYEMKKERKKEEDKIVKEEGSIAFSVEKAKKTKSVQELLEKVKKIDIKIAALGLLKWIVSIFEQFILWIVGFFGISGFFIAIVAVVILLIFRGLISINMVTSENSFLKDDECIESTQVIQNTGYDFSNMGQLSGTMTEHQKNLMRFLSLYEDYLSRDDVWANPEYVNEIKAVLGEDKLFDFMHGFSFCETGGYFTVMYSYSKEKNILEYSSTLNQGYCFLGLIKGDKFDKYYTGYTSAMSTDSFIEYVKNKYIPKDYQVTDNNYAPYGVATQLSLVGNESLRHYNDTVEKLLPPIMDKYGIQAHRDELMAYCKLFTGASYYHSLHTGLEELLSIWCGIWSATSDVDANRSFDNIKVVYDELYLGEKMYGEGTARQFIFGVDKPNNNLTIQWNQACDTFFEINGTPINTTLLTWVRDNCSNKSEFETNLNSFVAHFPAGSKSAEERNNVHYGLYAYLITPKIVSDLGGSVPVASGGNIEDCDCYEGGTGGGGSIGNRDFSNVVVGEPQGIYPDNILAELKKYTKYQPYYGRFDSLENPNEKLHWSGTMTREEWRQRSKWKVPYEYQCGGDNWQASNIGDMKVKMRGSYAKKYNPSTGTYSQNDACPIYSQSYVYSAMTGRAVNVQEIMAAEAIYRSGKAGVESGGYDVYRAEFCRMAKDAGFYVRYMNWSGGKAVDSVVTEGAKSNAPILYPTGSLKEQIDYVLENNGIVVVHVIQGPFRNSQHHFPIIQKTGENSYLTHDGAHRDSQSFLDLREHTLEYIIGTNGSYLSSAANNLMFAWSPNLSTSSGGTSQGTQNSGSNIPVPTPTSNDPDDVAEAMWKYLRSNGFSEESTAAIIGNSWGESGLKADILQGGTPHAAGLFQWESYVGKTGRWKELDNFAKKKGKDWTDFGVQMEYMLYGKDELEYCLNTRTGPENADRIGHYDNGTPYGWPTKVTLDDFKSNTNIEEATKIFEQVFERASKPHIERRIDAAKKYYNMFKGTLGGSSIEKITNFKDFLFIGDSLTNQMNHNINLVSEGADVVAEGGISVSSWDGKYFDNLENLPTDLRTNVEPGYSISVTHSLSDLKGVVIMLGSNGFGYSDYELLLKELLNKVSCNIYVQSIPPCTSTYTYIPAKDYKAKAEKYNANVKAFCDSTDRLYYIDTFSNMLDSNGYLDTQYSGDGIHLRPEKYQKQYDNILAAINSLAVLSSNNGTSVDCISDTSQSIVEGSFTETPGKFQGPYGDISSYIDKLTNESLKTKYKELLPYVGMKPINEGESNYSYTQDKWVKLNGKGFVRYSQCNANQKEPWHSKSFGDSTFVSAGCGVYATAGALSTMTGKYITPVEVAIAVTTYTLRHPGETMNLTHMNGDSEGAFTVTDLKKVIEEFGFNVEQFYDSSLKKYKPLDKAKLDETLDKDGLVLMVFKNTFNKRYANSGHYLVIREKTDKGYLIYSSTNWASASNDDYCNYENTWEEITSANGGEYLESDSPQILYITK